MSATNYDSRTADKFVVRLPDGLRADIEAAANAGDRSMNSVFIQAVRQYLDGQNRQQILLDALAGTLAAPVPSDSMHIDERVRMVVNAKRYEWLRDSERFVDGTRSEGDISVAAGDQIVFGHDLDKNVDDAMRLARLVELHP